MKNFLIAFYKLHKFFVEQSPSFMQGTPQLEYYSYYPIAYCKFMWYSFEPWIKSRKFN
jgi:hypothetical protein